MEKETENYELSFWFASQLSEKEVEQKFNDLIKQIESLEGKIFFSQLPQLLPMAYPIKGETNGYFGYFQFSFPKENYGQLREQLKFNSDILRYLAVKIESPGKSKLKKYHPEEGKKEKIYDVQYKGLEEIKKQGEEKTKEDRKEEINLEELDQKLNEILKE